jgi:hyperosmotically inducible periplasmic protein
MKMRAMAIGLCMAAAFSLAGRADANDTWITTKAKLALLTTDGIRVAAPNVDTVNGNVTLHGKVRTEAEKTRAEVTVKKLDGVKTVKNLIQVVPESERKAVNKNDADIKARAKDSLKDSEPLKDVSVASVNDGVVLLSGKTKSLDDKLKAVERVYAVDGVERVATEIEVVED